MNLHCCQLSVTPRSRRLTFAVVALSALIGVAAAIVGALRPGAATPPALAGEGLDSAVVAALERGRAAVIRRPRSGASWGELGMLFLAHHFDSQAAVCLVRAEELEPRNPRWPYLQAMVLSFENSEQSVRKLERAVELAGDDFDMPRLRLAEALLAQDRIDEAERKFLEILNTDGANSRARLGLARVALQRDRPDAGIDQLAHALDNPSTRKGARQLLAQLELRRGNRDKADAALREAATLPDDTPWPDPYAREMSQRQTGRQAALERAAQLLGQGRSPEAVEVLNHAVHDYPDAHYAWYLLGVAHLRMNDVAEGEQALRTSLRLEKNSAEARFQLGAVLFSRGMMRQAADCFRESARLKPDAGDAYYMLGQCLVQTGDPAQAMAAFRTALHCRPQFADAHAALAELAFEEGRNDEALVHLRQAASLKPADERIRDFIKRVENEVPASP